MKSLPLFKTFILTLGIVVIFVLGWEYYWRSRGFKPAYNDDKMLWATRRKEIYKAVDEATIFIGSSRSRFDIDIPTWEEITGEDAIQLAFGGTSPRPILHNLAGDNQFKGKVIIDVAEQIFFSIDSVRGEKVAQDALEYFINETPAQKGSTWINYFFESKFVFLEEGKFGLTALLNDLELANRPGVFVRPPFPKEFSMLSFDRQSKFTPMFLSDSLLQKRQLEARNKVIASGKVVPIKGKVLESYLNEIKTSLDKIRSRGGTIVFIRPPSNGAALEREERYYPRHEYWDHLLKFTRTPGYYFLDDPKIADLVCVDQSHLSPSNAVRYTKQLIHFLEKKEGWMFPKRKI